MGVYICYQYTREREREMARRAAAAKARRRANAKLRRRRAAHRRDRCSTANYLISRHTVDRGFFMAISAPLSRGPWLGSTRDAGRGRAPFTFTPSASESRVMGPRPCEIAPRASMSSIAPDFAALRLMKREETGRGFGTRGCCSNALQPLVPRQERRKWL